MREGGQFESSTLATAVATVKFLLPRRRRGCYNPVRFPSHKAVRRPRSRREADTTNGAPRGIKDSRLSGFPFADRPAHPRRRPHGGRARGLPVEGVSVEEGFTSLPAT